MSANADTNKNSINNHTDSAHTMKIIIETIVSATEPTQTTDFFICQFVWATMGHAHWASGFVVME